MKKIIAILLILVLVVGTSVACTKPAGETNGNTNEGTAAGDDIGVVLIVNTNLGDKSFCDLSNAGLIKAAKDLGVRTKVVELGGDATKQIPTFTEFAEDPEWDIIISGTYNVKESLQTVAEQYPDKKFILYDAKADYDDLDLPNVYSVEHKQNEGSFLVGAAAAMLTTSGRAGTNDKNIIGFVAGGENTSINDFMVGYIQGAQSVDENIKVLISYIGDFKDSAKGKEMALAQINQGADVVFAVAGGAGLGVLDAAKEKGVYSIGVDKDQAVTFEESNPELAKTIATSMVKKVDMTVYNAIKGAVEGTLPFGKYEAVGLAAGSVGAAKNKYYDEIFTTDQKAKISELEKKITSGEIKVQTAIGMDNTETQRIKDSVRP
ncbi:MAG: BMP family ABC transporter substrate-binding protein [Lutisporaceae bacterium]